MTQAVRSAAQVQVQVKVKAQAQAEAKQTEMSTGILSSRDKKYNTRHSIKKGGKKALPQTCWWVFDAPSGQEQAVW